MIIWTHIVSSQDVVSAFSTFFIFLRQRGRNADPMHVIVKMDMGVGSGSSAIKGERIVLNLANKLHMPNAVATVAVGNSYGIAI